MPVIISHRIGYSRWLTSEKAMRRTKTAKVVRLPKNLQAVAGGESLQGALGKQIWTLAGEDSPSPVLCFPSPQPKKLSERVRKTKFTLTTWQTVIL